MSQNILAKYRDVVEYITARKRVTVSELSTVFFLSESTVRRILRQLEKVNYVERFHGGAVLKDIDFSEQNIVNRKDQMSREKVAIALKAASLIEEGMTIILLGGSTVHAMCPYLQGKQLTVITSSIPVVNDLMNEENIKVILLGGIVNPSELEVRGGLTIAGLERLRADQVFVGATNIHEAHGLMTNDPEAVATYRACMAAADRVFVLADSTKFKPGGAAIVASFDELDDIITDDSIQKQMLTSLQDKGVRVHLVEV